MSEETQDVSTEQEIKTDAQESEKTQEELKTEEVQDTSEETTEAPAVDEVDYEALVKAQDEIIVKTSADRDNYRKMALKYKKGEEPEVKPELSDEDRIRNIVKEEFYNSEIAKAQKIKDDLLAKALRENKELKTAQRNFGKANISAGGRGAEEKKSETSSLSPELTKQLTQRAMNLGQDPKKYIELYLKNSRNKLTT